MEIEEFLISIDVDSSGAKALLMRFGIGKYKEKHTYKKIGSLLPNRLYKNKLSVSSTRARELVRKAVRQLRHPMRKELLDNYLTKQNEYILVFKKILNELS
jgi:DNA-directed RNA polymerase sigma subunit (sigma70/sigma32)